jgi:hypothetical protein
MGQKYSLKWITIRRGKQKIGDIPVWVKSKVDKV